ncbi:hypothetical protein [Beijerinckia sp. L45]|uniref:hypothetical protein n=1 Tax=Beijerinckia sp. L45 TaxID=1641855 RepID=UPI00131DCE5A|nr:hypothetical protein [Beijerinckia sp. L45]
MGRIKIWWAKRGGAQSHPANGDAQAGSWGAKEFHRSHEPLSDRSAEFQGRLSKLLLKFGDLKKRFCLVGLKRRTRSADR